MLAAFLLWQAMANNYGAFVSTVPAFLNVVDFAHRLVGPKPLEYLSGAMNRMTNHLVPTWNPYMPRVQPQNTLPTCLALSLMRSVSWTSPFALLTCSPSSASTCSSSLPRTNT